MGKILPVQNPQRALDFFIELILLFALISSPCLLGSVNLFAVTTLELGALLILFLWLIKLVKNGSIELAGLPINIPIAAFLIFVALQYFFINFFVPDFNLGEIYRQRIKQEAIKFSSCLIFFYAIINNIQARKKINRLLFFLVIIGFALSIVGIIQKVSGAKKIFWLYDIKSSEVFFSSFPNRNHFASYINMTIFLTLGIIFSRLPFLRAGGVIEAVSASFKRGVWLYVFCLIIMSTGLFYSLSRGGILSFVCGIGLFSILILIKGLTRRGYFILFFVLIFILIMLVWINAPEQIIKRFGLKGGSEVSFIERTYGGRKDLSMGGIDMIKAYPLFGVGFGALEFIYNKKYMPDSIKFSHIHYYIDHIHNDFLELFSETGVVGFLIFCIAAFLFAAYVIKALLKRSDPFVVGTSIGAVSSLFVMSVHSLFDFHFHIASNAILFFVIAGLSITIINSQIKEGAETTLIVKKKLLVVKGAFAKIVLSLILAGVFFSAALYIIKPYLAYRISQDKGVDIAGLKEAIRLDPLNDRYHFLLAGRFIKDAAVEGARRNEYLDAAVIETKEAIRLNPWDDYYPAYLDWIIKTFGR